MDILSYFSTISWLLSYISYLKMNGDLWFFISKCLWAAKRRQGSVIAHTETHTQRSHCNSSAKRYTSSFCFLGLKNDGKQGNASYHIPEVLNNSKPMCKSQRTIGKVIVLKNLCIFSSSQWNGKGIWEGNMAQVLSLSHYNILPGKWRKIEKLFG